MASCPRFILIVVALLASMPVVASAQSIPDGFYYKLSTEFRGSVMKLDVFNGGPKNNMTHLEPDQNVTGQFWRITAIDGGWYQLSTQFRGSNVLSRYLQRRFARQRASSDALRQLLRSALADHRRQSCVPAHHRVSRSRHVPGYFQRR